MVLHPLKNACNWIWLLVKARTNITEMGGRASVAFFPLNSSANKLILASNSHAAVQNWILLKHNYWSPKLQVILKGKWNPEKNPEDFYWFWTCQTRYLHVTQRRKSSTLINYSTNPKGGIDRDVLIGEKGQPQPHTVVICGLWLSCSQLQHQLHTF